MLFSKEKSFLSWILIALLSTSLCSSCRSSSQSPPIASETEVTNGESPEACAPEITQIQLGILATESQENLATLWTPFLEKMTAAIGRRVQPFYGDYTALIQAMANREIQVGWYGGKAYIEAAETANAEAFAQTVSSQGFLGYYSYLITYKGHPILEKIDLSKGDGDRLVLDNAANLTFAFNDQKSTSGFLVPMYYLFIQNNLEPETIFKSVSFLGSHEETALAIANQKVDIATNNSEALERLRQTQPEQYEKLQIIWTSPVIPGDPIAYRKDLPDCLKTELQDFFYTFTDRTILEPLIWSGFDPATDRDWNTIRELEIAKQIQTVKQDQTLTEPEKATKLETLQQQLKALQ